MTHTPTAWDTYTPLSKMVKARSDGSQWSRAGAARTINFLVWGGTGCSFTVTQTWAIQVGYRIIPISNASTDSPDSGLNFGLPFIGLP